MSNQSEKDRGMGFGARLLLTLALYLSHSFYLYGFLAES